MSAFKNILTIFWSVSHFDTDHFSKTQKINKYFFDFREKTLAGIEFWAEKRWSFSSSPYQRGVTQENIFFLHFKKRARKNPETVVVTGFFGAISFLLAQYGCGGRT
jgi:hypothetical protein